MLPFEKNRQKVLERTTSQSEHGTLPGQRSVQDLLERGIVVIDKPAGPTSHQVSAYVQRILGIDKSGHSGTLDPAVTGVLPVALGKGTRIVQSLLTAGKEYVCLMHLHTDVTDRALEEAFEAFTGKIRQMPPIKSAVKRRWRYRKVYYLELLDRQDRDVLFRVGCQAGTYIRKLCSDMGTHLGGGAHMVELRRTKAAGFSERDAVTLQDLTDAFHYHRQGSGEQLKRFLLPIETGVRHLPKIWVHDSAVEALCNGVQLKLPGIVRLHEGIQEQDSVAVMTLKDELILVGRAMMPSRDLLGERGLAVRTEQVFMPAGTYPRM